MAYTTINKGSSYFNTLTWSGSGNSSGRSFTGVGFKPDWVWQKVRTTTYGHEIFDIIRTTNRLASNTTNAETALDQYGYISSFDTDGFTTTPGSTDNTGWNEVGQNYVAWNWLGANTTVSNTSGTLTSTVSANPTAGFSIVGWTGDGVNNRTVGHGLGATPKFIIIKNRSAGTAFWSVINPRSTSTTDTNMLYLNSTAAEADDTNIMGTNLPNSTTFGIGDYTGVNVNAQNFIAYCFAPIKGYSAMGQYTGNGSADGTFVYTGFKPAFVMIKQTGTPGSGWLMYDSKRNTYNFVDLYLQANQANAEAGGSTDNPLDFLSNGFKLRYSNSATNDSGGTYIYAAFAENPFVTSGGIPVTAR
jgi:hypothetical protein